MKITVPGNGYPVYHFWNGLKRTEITANK